MIYYGAQKEGYHVDELYSYGLSNSEYLPFMHFGESGYSVKDWMMDYGAGESLGDLFRNLSKDFQLVRECGFQIKDTPIYTDYLTAQSNSSDTRTTTWVSGQSYRNYLAVSENNTFNYASVYYNQRGDVHPPLYYILLHTICSLFPGFFSKWFGLALNFLILLLTLWILYYMVSSYLGGKTVALAVVLCYGFSCGFMTTALFLRMYALLTLMTVICSCIHLKIAANGFIINKRNRIFLILSTLGGFLTHYYFVIYVLMTAMVFVIWMTVKGKRKAAISYTFTMIISAIIGLCIWPFAIKHVFLGYRGRETLETLSTGEFYWIKVKVVLHYIFQFICNGWYWIPLTCTLVLILALIFIPKEHRPLGKVLLLFIPNAIYILLVSQIVPYLVERYFMCTFPFWCLLAVESVWLGAAALRYRWPSKIQLTKSTVFRPVALFVFTIFIVLVNNCWIHTPGCLYSGGQETLNIPEHTTCIYVMPDGSWNESATYSSVFAKCDCIATIYCSNLSSLANGYKYTPESSILIMVSNSLDPEPIIKEIRQILQVQELPVAYNEKRIDTTVVCLSNHTNSPSAESNRTAETSIHLP